MVVADNGSPAQDWGAGGPGAAGVTGSEPGSSPSRRCASRERCPTARRSASTNESCLKEDAIPVAAEGLRTTSPASSSTSAHVASPVAVSSQQLAPPEGAAVEQTHPPSATFVATAPSSQPNTLLHRTPLSCLGADQTVLPETLAKPSLASSQPRMPPLAGLGSDVAAPPVALRAQGAARSQPCSRATGDDKMSRGRSPLRSARRGGA